MNEVIHSSFCGNLTSGGTTGSAKNYRGEYYDSETGLYYLNARYYDPTTQQFTQEDTYGGDMEDPGSLNLYGYCEGNPVMSSDPTGHLTVYVPQYIYDNDLSNADMVYWSMYGADCQVKGTTDSSMYYKLVYYDPDNNSAGGGDGSLIPSQSDDGSGDDASGSSIQSSADTDRGESDAENGWGVMQAEAGTGTAEAELVKAKYSGKYKYGKYRSSYSLGKVGASAQCHISKESGFEIGASADASASSAELSGVFGNDNLGLTGDAEGGLGNASASAKIGADEDFTGIDLEAKASAAEGSAAGGIDILGVNISVGVEGYAGGAGVEFKAGMQDGKFNMKAGAIEGLGGSVYISIGKS